MAHANGGPAGELVLFWSLIHSLTHMADVSVTVIQSMEQLREVLHHDGRILSTADASSSNSSSSSSSSGGGSSSSSSSSSSLAVPQDGGSNGKIGGTDHGRAAVFLFLDEYGLDDVKRQAATVMTMAATRAAGSSHSRPSNVFETWKCRLRFMDFWGTPPNQNHEKLAGQQFLVPYPHHARVWDNYFLGYLPVQEYAHLHSGGGNAMLINSNSSCGRSVQDGDAVKAKDKAKANANAKAKKAKVNAWTPKPVNQPSGILYGKMVKYFRGKARMIRRIAEIVQALYFTVSRAQENGGDPRSVAEFRHLLHSSPNIHNLGFLTKARWTELLQNSTFIIGFGDPILGPTLMDGLMAGCVFINPRYKKPKHIIMTPSAPAHTQHDYGVTIGEPQVYTVDLDDTAMVLGVVKRILSRSRAPEMQQPLLPWAFQPSQYNRRVRHMITHPVCSGGGSQRATPPQLDSTSKTNLLVCLGYTMKVRCNI
jgi:hypothetical protein